MADNKINFEHQDRFVLKEIESITWKTFEDQFNDNPFLSGLWLKAFESRTKKPVFFAVYENNLPVAAISGLLIQSGHVFFKGLTKQLYFFSGPIILDRDKISEQQFIEYLSLYARKKRIHRIYLGSYYHFSEYSVENINFNKKVREECVIDLTEDLAQIEKNMKRQQRRLIVKAGEMNLDFSETSDIEALQQLATGMQMVKDRKEEKGHKTYNPFYMNYLNVKELRNLVISGIGHIYQISEGDEVLCSVFVVEYKQKAFVIYWGATQAGYKKGVSVYLFWKIINKYVTSHIHSLNMGGLPKDSSREGIKAFKKSLGAVEEVCTGGKIENIQGPVLTFMYDQYKKISSFR